MKTVHAARIATLLSWSWGYEQAEIVPSTLLTSDRRWFLSVPMDPIPAHSEDESRTRLYRLIVFWCVIPFIISLQRILNIEDLSGTMQVVYLVYSFAISIFGWVHFHVATYIISKFFVPKKCFSSKHVILIGFIVMLIGSIIADIILLFSRPLRFDIYCILAEYFDGKCIAYQPLHFDQESLTSVLRLMFLHSIYWLMANYVIALLFRFEPYGFRITHIRKYFDRENEGPDEELSPLMGRLPAHIGTDIIAIAANQHYVDVHTRQGHTLILYRLSDAIKEMGDKGVQIHRSYWVAYDAITDIRRDSGTYIIVLHNGLEFPISRAYHYLLKSQEFQKVARS